MNLGTHEAVVAPSWASKRHQSCKDFLFSFLLSFFGVFGRRFRPSHCSLLTRRRKHSAAFQLCFDWILVRWSAVKFGCLATPWYFSLHRWFLINATFAAHTDGEKLRSSDFYFSFFTESYWFNIGFPPHVVYTSCLELAVNMKPDEVNMFNTFIL